MSASSVSRRLVAILSADAVGYSRAMSEHESMTERRLRASLVLISEHVRAYGGRVVDDVGDNLLAEFGSAVDAVAAAVEVQRELSRMTEDDHVEGQMLFRIGISLGDVLVERKRIAGHAVNLAARLEGLASPGGIAVLGAVYDAVHGRLPLKFRDSGEREIKNMPPVRVYYVEIPNHGEAMPRSGQLLPWKFRRSLSSRSMLILTLLTIVAGFGLVGMAPSSMAMEALIGGSGGFSLFFSYLFFRYGITSIPIGHRSVVTVCVTVLLFALTAFQARSALVAVASILEDEPTEIAVAVPVPSSQPRTAAAGSGPGARTERTKQRRRVPVVTSARPNGSDGDEFQGEIHLVAIYEGEGGVRNHETANASVIVDRPDEDLILVLSAYEPTTWFVDVLGGRVEKVILAGNYRQEVVGLSRDIKVENRFYGGESGNPPNAN